MSTRTALTVVDCAANAEDGPATRTLENMDVTLGNKLANDGRTLLKVRNTTGGSLNITFTYDYRGASVTKAVAIGANEETTLGPFPPGVFNAHAADSAENLLQTWLTAGGGAGDLKARAIRYQPGVFA